VGYRSVAAAFSAGCLYSIIAPESGGAFARGILGFAPTLIYAGLEGFTFALGNRGLGRTLGKLNLGCAAFFTFGLVTNIAEAFTEETPPSLGMLVIVTTIFGVIIGYLCVSGMFRLRASEPPAATSRTDYRVTTIPSSPATTVTPLSGYSNVGIKDATMSSPLRGR
jgi:hypothetical protein